MEDIASNTKYSLHITVKIRFNSKFLIKVPLKIRIIRTTKLRILIQISPSKHLLPEHQGELSYFISADYVLIEMVKCERTA